MKVGDSCVRDVVYVEPSASLYSVAEQMRHHHVGCVVVANKVEGDGKPLGIITDRDLVIEVLAPRLDPDKLLAEDIMTFNLTVAREDEDLWEVVHRMESESVRRVPVVNAQEQLAGIFSLDDLLRVFASELHGIAGLVNHERGREAAVRV
ncbi:CBS domain-containing protein [Gilvimarinus sp. F26214L]|uniref:CBS domain-containing protein n=1 Tax=Gilvimarinus sp. DZF01 TaxID=3461371 RepID=UPI0040458E3A